MNNSRRAPKRFGGKTPADVYTGAVFAPTVTPEEIESARAWIAELQRRQEQMRRTREARLDPVRIQILKDGLAALGIANENDRLSTALACYAREAIGDGLATFRAKMELGTLSAEPSKYGRYLGGTIRQLNIRMELELKSQLLLE